MILVQQVIEGFRITRSLFRSTKCWFQTITMHHSLVCSSNFNKLDMVIEGACLVHNSRDHATGSQFRTAAFFNCRGVQPHLIPQTEGLPMFLFVNCQLVSLMGLLQVIYYELWHMPC